jgi:hypothetical protein
MERQHVVIIDDTQKPDFGETPINDQLHEGDLCRRTGLFIITPWRLSIKTTCRISSKFLSVLVYTFIVLRTNVQYTIVWRVRPCISNVCPLELTIEY